MGSDPGCWAGPSACVTATSQRLMLAEDIAALRMIPSFQEPPSLWSYLSVAVLGWNSNTTGNEKAALKIAVSG